MHLITLLVLLLAHFNFWYTATHVAGKKNILADAISRNNANSFLSQMPHINQQPTEIPQQLRATGTSGPVHHMDLHILDPAIR